MPATHIGLPMNRAHQVREIAKAKGLSITDLISTWVDAEIANGTIPNQMPGISLGKKQLGVVVSAPHLNFDAVIAFHDVPAVADLLRNPPEAHAPKAEVKKWNEKAYSVFSVIVTRRGSQSVFLEKNGARIALNRFDANTFADLLEEAAR